MAFAFDIDDGAGAGEVGAAEFGRDGIERGVAAGAVDDGVETGVERHGAVGGIEGEGGYIGDAVDEDAVELADKSSGRVKHASNAFDGAEVGVGEGVAAGDIGVAGAFDVPGTEGAGGVDITAGNGVGEGGVIRPCGVAADVVHDDAFQHEVFGVLARLGGTDDELGIVAEDLAEDDFDFAVVLLRVRVGPAVLLGRDVDGESADMHV